MIILVEGPSGAGKTTLARDLATRFHLRYAHEGPPPADTPALAHYGRLLDDARRHRERTGEGTIFDRFARGERVYGPILRGRDTLGADGWRVFNRLVRASDARQVLCLPSLGACLDAFVASGGARGLVRDPATMRAQYAAWAEQRLAPDWTDAYSYDWTAPNATLDLDLYLTTPRPTLPSPVIGSPTASVLLVGDQVGDASPTSIELPFFATTGSSAYLTWTLDVAKIPEAAVAFVNARDRLGAWHAIPPTNVAGVQWCIVALGRVAAAACEQQKLVYRRADHPQFWRRFYHADVMTYARQLQEVIR